MTNLNSHYTTIDTYELEADSEDIAANILHPERTIVRYTKGRIYIFRICYLDRKALNNSGVSRKERLKVNPMSLCSKRVGLSRLIIIDMITGLISLTQASQIERILNWIDNKGRGDDLHKEDTAKSLYADYTHELLHHIRLSKVQSQNKGISRTTARAYQSALNTIICYSTGVSTRTIDTWALIISTKDSSKSLPVPRLNNTDVQIASAMHERFFWAYSNAVLINQKTPLIVELEDLGFDDYIAFSKNNNSYNKWNTDLSNPADAWRNFAFSRNGFCSDGWPTIRARAFTDGVQLAHASDSNRGFTNYSSLKWRHLKLNGLFDARTLTSFSNRAVYHFAHLLLLNTGANAAHLDGIEFTATRLTKTVGAERLIAVKGRSGHEAQKLYVDSGFIKIWRQHNAIRNWMQTRINKKIPDTGLFKIGINKSFTPVTQNNLTTKLFWPKDAPSLVTRTAKKAKTQKILEASKGDIAVTAQLTSTTEKTIRKHYSFKKFEDAAKQLTAFFEELRTSAKLRVYGEPVAPIVEKGSKIHTGRCIATSEDDKQLIEGYDERAPQPHCGSPTTCFFCESFGIHASTEDIVRLLSVKTWITYQSQHKSHSLQEHARKFLPIVERINEIVESFENRDKASKKITQTAIKQIESGNIDPFWKNLIDALIDTMEEL